VAFHQQSDLEIAKAEKVRKKLHHDPNKAGSKISRK
jgi:hypothetical protein